MSDSAAKQYKKESKLTHQGKKSDATKPSYTST